MIEYRGESRLFLTMAEWDNLQASAPDMPEAAIRGLIEGCGRKPGKLRKPALLKKFLSFFG